MVFCVDSLSRLRYPFILLLKLLLSVLFQLVALDMVTDEE